MQRIAVLSLAFLASLAVGALADPVISFEGDDAVHTYVATTAGGTITANLYISNDPNTTAGGYVAAGGMVGIDAYVALGPGGFATDGSDPGPVFATGAPVDSGPNGQAGNSGYVINGIDPITGTIFSSNHSPAGDGGFSTDQQSNVSMNTSAGTVLAPDLPGKALLLTLHIVVPAGLPAGSDWIISIDGNNNIGLPLDLADGGNFQSVLLNGRIWIPGPEPSSAVLGGLAIVGFGLVAMRRRGWRRTSVKGSRRQPS